MSLRDREAVAAIHPRSENRMCETLEIGLDENLLALEMAQEIATPGVRPVQALEQLLSQHLTRGLRRALGNRFIKEPLARIVPHYFKNVWAVLSDLEVGGYETWYTELKFSTRPDDCFNSVDVKPSGFVLDLDLPRFSGEALAHLPACFRIELGW
jgi:hypothetical protein